MASGPVTIVKVGGSPPPPKPVSTKKKTMRTFPRGVLKGGRGASLKGLQPVANPTKPPPIRAGRTSTLRILTEKGAAKRRETIHKKVKSMPIESVRKTLRQSGLHVSDKTPSHIAKEILEGGMEAGMIVSR
jgi:hypothetical protein